MSTNTTAPPLMTLGQALENHTVQLLLISRLYDCACYGAVVWEWIITWRGEAKFWQEKWTLLKATFLIERYWTLITGALFLAYAGHDWPIEACERAHVARQIFSGGVLFWADCILLTRCYALWGKSKIIGFGGLFFLAGQIAVFYVSAVRSTATVAFPAGVQVFACLIAPKPGHKHLALAQWIYPWSMDFVLTVLTAYRVLAYRARGATSGLLDLFLRDGLLYFFIVSAVESINLGFIIQSSNPILSRISGLPTFLLTSLICQRLALSLRLNEQGGTYRTGSGTQSKASTIPSSTLPITVTSQRTTDYGRGVAQYPVPVYHYPSGYPPSSPSTSPYGDYHPKA